MCAIFGMMLKNNFDTNNIHRVKSTLYGIMAKSKARGRDGIGIEFELADGRRTSRKFTKCNQTNIHRLVGMIPFEAGQILIGNCRAEPTTEYIKNKSEKDQQPYSVDNWSMVHNGTIANDYSLRTGEVDTMIDSAAIAEQLSSVCELKEVVTFNTVIDSLEGSYAILAHCAYGGDFIHYATNFKPIWFLETEDGVYFASSREFFSCVHNPVKLEPYTRGYFRELGDNRIDHTCTRGRISPPGGKALVVASGGLDSTVVASELMQQGYNVTLLNFNYGCNAETKEALAIAAIGDRLGVPVVYKSLPMWDTSDSPILNKGSTIATGEAGAELAHEWVPARNLVMVSCAVAIAESQGYDVIALGNNLEEGGAYPDNEPEFYNMFKTVLPYAIGANRHIELLSPVGNLMKHEIVAMGIKNGAPMDLTWSCYKDGEQHCGNCGPCFMRKTAFEINNEKDTVEYDNG